MKKQLLIFTFLLITNLLFAQRFDAGVLVGLNGCQVEGDKFKGFHKAGIVMGIFAQTDLTPTWSAGLEIKYSQKGSRYEYDSKHPEIDKYTMRLGYMEVPVFIGFRSSNKTNIVAGLSPGILIHSKEINSYGEFPVADQHPFKRFDLEPFIGFQFNFWDHAWVDLRFAMSVIPIRESPNETNCYWENNQFNNVVTLAVYYKTGH